MRKTCPSTEELRLILSSEPSGSELGPVESHILNCTACLERLERQSNVEAPEIDHFASAVEPSRHWDDQAREFLEALKRILPPEIRSAIESHARDFRPGSKPESASTPSAERVLPQIPGYELLREIGRGSMGVVYEARQSSLNRPVALKTILAGIQASDSERARFHQEAEAVARLHHLHVVQIYEIGEHESQPYLALEFVAGEDLATRLQGKPQDLRWSVELVETLARAVHYAHEHGVLHRDLKPANILLTTSGLPKIADFGLAKSLDDGRGSISSTGLFMGTPSYMAPEQAIPPSEPSSRRAELGPRADVYSLGAILYEMLTGQPPFRAKSSLETVLQMLHHDPVAPSRLRPKLPLDLETICLGCLRKEPARRYPSALALAEDLRRHLMNEPILARPVAPLERLWKWARRRPATAILVATGALLLVLGFAEITLLWRIAEGRATLEWKNKEVEARALKESQKRNSELLLERSLAICEQGRIGEGMLGLVQALEHCPGDLPDLQRVIRSNLSAWRYRVTSQLHHLGHPRPVTVVAYSPDGRKILTGCEDGNARLWDVGSGKLTIDPFRHNASVRVVVFSPDGQTVLTGSEDGTARLWEAATGKGLGAPLRHDDVVATGAFSPDSRTVLTGGKEGIAQLWDVATSRPLQKALRHRGAVLSVAFSPDGQTILTGSEDQTARLWSLRTGEPIGPPLKHGDTVQAVAFSPDGRRAATGSKDGSVCLWDPANGALLLPPFRHPYPVWTFVFSPNGESLLSGSGLPGKLKGEGRLWNCTTGLSQSLFFPHKGRVGSVAWSPSGYQVLTGSEENGASLCLATTERLQRLQIWVGGSINALAFGPDDRTFLTAGINPAQTSRGEARLFSTPPKQQSGPTCQHPPVVSTVAISPNGRSILTGGTDQTVRLWDARTGGPIGHPLPHSRAIRFLKFSPDGQTFVTGDGNHETRLWNSDTLQPIALPQRNPGEVTMAMFSPDSHSLATVGHFPSIRLWDIRSGRFRDIELPNSETILAVDFSPDNHFVVTGGNDSVARLWDVATGSQIGSGFRHPRPIRSIAFSPDGQSILTGCADSVSRIWNIDSGQLSTSPMQHPIAVNLVAYHPNGRTVATIGGDSLARLWDVATGSQIGPAFLCNTSTLAFAPSGQTLLTGGWDGTAQFWNLPELLQGTNEQVRVWCQIVTGIDADSKDDVPTPLSTDKMNQLRRRWRETGSVPSLFEPNSGMTDRRGERLDREEMK